MTHFTRKKPLVIIAAVLAVLMLTNALAMTIGAASGSKDLRATLDRLVYSIRSLTANKPAVLAEPEEPVYGDPYYTVNTSEPLTIDEKGHIITLNDEDGYTYRNELGADIEAVKYEARQYLDGKYGIMQSELEFEDPFEGIEAGDVPEAEADGKAKRRTKKVA